MSYTDHSVQSTGPRSSWWLPERTPQSRRNSPSKLSRNITQYPHLLRTHWHRQNISGIVHQSTFNRTQREGRKTCAHREIGNQCLQLTCPLHHMPSHSLSLILILSPIAHTLTVRSDSSSTHCRFTLAHL